MLRVALAQINLTVGDLRGNTAKILRWVEKAKRNDADVVAFPELAISGYPPEDLLLRPRFLADCREALESLASRIKGIVAIVGFPRGEGTTYNSAAVIAGGRIVGTIDKVHLPNYGVFDEKRYFTPGERAGLIVLDRTAIGISICEDIWEGDVVRAQVLAGASIALNISCSPYHTGKGVEREDLMAQRARQNGVYVAYVNLVGGQDELVFDGHSLIVDPRGNVIARGKQFSEDLIVADIDTQAVSKPRASHKRIKPEPKIISLRAGLKKRKRALRPHVPDRLDRLEEIYAALVLGTRDYVRKNGFKKAIVGLSGGIDSSLVATIAVDALGSDKVLGVSMPSRFSSKASITDARQLAAALGIRLIKIDIEPIFEAYLRTLKPLFKGYPFDVTEENIQARTRGNILMALSNKFGYLVLTTGNKSELAVGYCTLYGDLAGGFAILKDVPKTLVYELARYRNSRGKQVIPERVFAKPPSAELRPDQRDEDSLPPYDLLDPILEMFVVEDMPLEEIVAKGFPPRVVSRVARLVDSNEYKRRQGPPGVKITPRAFGKDRRMPITNRYR